MTTAANKTLDNIWSSLENLQEFVISSKVAKVDRKILSMIECELLCLEGKLRLFSDYKPAKRNK